MAPVRGVGGGGCLLCVWCVLGVGGGGGGKLYSVSQLSNNIFEFKNNVRKIDLSIL